MSNNEEFFFAGNDSYEEPEEAKALFFFTEEWSEDKSEDELLSIIHIIIDAHIVSELERLTVGPHQWETLFDIMGTKLFANTLKTYADKVENEFKEDDEAIYKLFEIKELISMFIKEETHIPDDVAHIYLILVMGLFEYYIPSDL